MKLIIFAFVIFVVASSEAKKKCLPVDDAPKCPSGQVYQKKGPGPFCYRTCCGPQRPPCLLDSFTSGCFCKNQDLIKVYPVANNSLAEPNNLCVDDCSKINCNQLSCTKANEEWRDCGPTNMCDNQVCRGMRPMCPEEEAAVCVAGCFCKPGFSRFGGECIKNCPLLP